MSNSVPVLATIKPLAARRKIYQREVQGRYASLRWLCVWLTQLVFYGLPWLKWDGQPAMLFDLAAHRITVFGMCWWPQTSIYLCFAALLFVYSYALFLLTVVAGRVWCGFACPHSVYSEIFLWVERHIEGARSARIRLDQQPWSPGKLKKKLAKHAVWLAIAWWTGFTFVAYFVPLHILLREAAHLSFGPTELFWMTFYALVTYAGAGWLHERVCKYLCIYARFHVAMFDPDTLMVAYDSRRGEPRGARFPRARTAAMARGDCIDCSLCIQTCPTGLDIRHGMQPACIDCAACVDACNLVMQKVGLPLGLIRYSTEHAIGREASSSQILRRMLRPRVLLHAGVLSLIVLGLFKLAGH